MIAQNYTCEFLIVNSSIDFDSIAPFRALTLCVDVLVICLYRFIHISEIIREEFPNVLSTMIFPNLKMLRLERKTASRRLYECIIFLSPILLDIEFVQFEGAARGPKIF